MFTALGACGGYENDRTRFGWFVMGEFDGGCYGGRGNVKLCSFGKSSFVKEYAVGRVASIMGGQWLRSVVSRGMV
jgi:hypothetical protein